MKRYNWYYNINGKKYGPFPLKTIKKLISNGLLGKHTPIWHPSMQSWLQIQEIPTLAKQLPEKWLEHFTKLKSGEYRTSPLPTPISMHSQKKKLRSFIINSLSIMYLINMLFLAFFIFFEKRISVSIPEISGGVMLDIYPKPFSLIKSVEVYTYTKWFINIAMLWAAGAFLSYGAAVYLMQKAKHIYLNLKSPAKFERILAAIMHGVSIITIILIHFIILSDFKHVEFSPSIVLFVLSFVLIFPPLFIKTPYSSIKKDL